MHFSTETATEQRSEFASNPGWNNLIATMQEQVFLKSFPVFDFPVNIRREKSTI